MTGKTVEYFPISNLMPGTDMPVSVALDAEPLLIFEQAGTPCLALARPASPRGNMQTIRIYAVLPYQVAIPEGARFLNMTIIHGGPVFYYWHHE